MANVGIVSEWYRLDKPEELTAFLKRLRQGDIVQIKSGNNFYFGAICSRDGTESRFVHRFGQRQGCFLSPQHSPYVKGSVHDIGLGDMHVDNCVRINNSKDRTIAPKPVKEVIHCVLEAVGTMDNDDQFGSSHESWALDREFIDRVRYPKKVLYNRLDKHDRSQWHTTEDLELFLWILRMGDMVEFSRKGVYSHWAVAAEWRTDHRSSQQWVVHRYGSGDAKELVKKLIGSIIASPIEEVIKGSTFRINNSRDRLYLPQDAGDINNFALKAMGSEEFGKYHLIFNNCWHFAMQARYRVKLLNVSCLKSEWYSTAEDIRPFLRVGDIIDFVCRPPEDLLNRAIYIERAKPRGRFKSLYKTNKRPEVAYFLPSDEPGGKAVVRLTSMDDFFGNIAKDFRIYNQWDWRCKPKCMQQYCEDIVKYVVGSEGKVYPYFFMDGRHVKRQDKKGKHKHDYCSNEMAESKKWLK